MRRLVFRMLASCGFLLSSLHVLRLLFLLLPCHHPQDAGLLQVSSVLAARSSIARPAALVPPASHLVAPSAARGASTGLHCDHCGRDGHVEAFCYRKKNTHKAQARRSSQGTGGSSSGGSERNSTGSETQELLMLLRRLATSMSSGAVGSVPQPFVLIGSAPSSSSFTLGPPLAPSSGTYPWYLDFGASFHMTPHFAHLSSLRHSY
jgi:hypothetical protein